AARPARTTGCGLRHDRARTVGLRTAGTGPGHLRDLPRRRHPGRNRARPLGRAQPALPARHMSGKSLPPQLRGYLSPPPLAQVWAAARTRLERNGLQVAGTLTLDLDEVAAERLSGLLGRPVEAGTGRRVKLAELDSALRRSAAGQGLITVLELLDGRPLIDRAAARQDAHAQWTQVWQDLDGALAASG